MTSTSPFSLLDALYADGEMKAIFSEDFMIEGWLHTEAALAQAQAAAEVITPEASAAITEACDPANIDVPTLWEEARNVGYPILPLVRMVAARLPPIAHGKLHLGATTQDIMDTGLALQISEAISRLDTLVKEVGDNLTSLVSEYRDTVIAARTHGQQAVPTTLGAKLAVYLTQFQRHRIRLREVRVRACVVSLHGAGGTSAAYGPAASEVRSHVAEALDLRFSAIPWHTARDGVIEFGYVCAAIAETCVRFAREVIDLSRTEIGELKESSQHHHGASSTMPQKVNPVWSEASVGFGALATGNLASLLRAMEAGHERAAGEWHIEWDTLPRLAVAAASSLSLTAKTTATLGVDAAAMQRNLEADGGLIMAESMMMRLAPTMGREESHDLVYEAAQRLRSRRDGESSLTAEIEELLPAESDERIRSISPAAYLGEVTKICDEALKSWAQMEDE